MIKVAMKKMRRKNPIILPEFCKMPGGEAEPLVSGGGSYDPAK